MSRARWLRGAAAVALLAGLAGCAGGGSGGGAAAPWQGLFNVPNIYVRNGATTQDDVRVPRAVVFGDSYSVQDPQTPFPFRQWNEQALRSGLFASMSNYAVGGAEASSTPRSGRSLEQQVDAFLQRDRYSGRELTLVFIGFNDIRLARSIAEMDAAEADAQVQFERLRAAGATADERRVFLLLSPDYGRYPNVADRATRTQYTLDWANFLTDYGNANANFVPVDVYTFFERVFRDPAKWGLVNVTTPDPANAVGPNATALFYDSVHFGERGHALLAALVEHYLTQAWDWSNTLVAGADTVRQLNADIDAGLITAFAGGGKAGETLAFAIGEAESGTETTTFAFAEEGRRGIGAGLRLTPGLGLALIHAEAGRDLTFARRDGEERTRSRFRAEGVALVGEALGFGWTARVTWGHEELARSRFDAVSATGSRGRAEVTHLAFGQRLATSFGVGGATLSPWVGLDVTRRRIGAYGMADPYLGRVRFGAATVTETLGRAGLRFELPPVTVGDGDLRLAADVAVVRDFSDDTVTLRLRQGRFGHRERVVLAGQDALTLGLSGDLTLGDGLRLGAGYGLTRTTAGTEHAAAVRLSWRWPVISVR